MEVHIGQDRRDYAASPRGPTFGAVSSITGATRALWYPVCLPLTIAE